YLQVSNPTTGLSVKIYWGDGTSQDYPTYGWSRYEHEYALPGTYTARAVLFDGSNNPLDSSQTIINGYCFHVKGAIYKRNDANCTYDIDTDEVLSIFQQIEVRKNNIPIDTFTANYYFDYPIPQADFTSEFSFHPLNLPGYQLACPASGY